MLTDAFNALSIRALATTSLTSLSAMLLAGAAQAGDLPTGGAVAAGSAHIVTGANSAVINQTSARAVLNWQTFSVGQGKTVVFNQPDSTSATLSRVTGSATSTIAGQISSNGAVYLVNANGIAITTTGIVNTAGGFVASTLNIADTDFMAGTVRFMGKGASAGVSNAGQIVAGQGAYVALLGGSVSNSGYINVPLGKVGLGSGESIALDLNGGGFMQVALPTSGVTGNAALVENAGSISASGGLVQLQAATVKNAVRNIINLSGSINADSATGNAGNISLIGGTDIAHMGGAMTVSGTLSARAVGASGDGGTVETSGAIVNFNGLTVNTFSVGGKTGTWLVDPSDLHVDATAAATISTNLATSNVTLQTNFSGLPTGPGTYNSGPGDIFVSAPISWSSANTLTLNAYDNIYLSSAINGTNGGLSLNAGYNNHLSGGNTIFPTADVNVSSFSLGSGGVWQQEAASLPAFSATYFSAAGNFLRTNTGDGSVGSPYQILDLYGLQGMLGSKNYILTTNLDASATAGWNSGAGYIPISFSGSLNGQSHTISNLTINRPTTTDVGLFSLLLGSVTNLGLVGGSVSGNNNVGGLAGQVTTGTITNSYTTAAVNGIGNGSNIGGLVGRQSGGTISGSYATGTVSGGSGIYVGGLVGYQTGATITGSYATGNVLGTASRAGGLVGYTNGTISSSYATGNVSGGSYYTGGFAGESAATLTGDFATGTVTGSYYVGGLAGTITGGAVTMSFATGTVVGVYAGGLTGYQTGGSLNQTYASGAVSGGGIVGGLVGILNGGTVARSYATGATSALTFELYAGGLIGSQGGGSVTTSFATGAVTVGSGGLAGGLVARQQAGNSLTSSYWDSYSTGRASGCGACSGTFTAAAVTSDPAQSGAANYAYNFSAYSAFAPADWVQYNGQTRPFGAWEVPVVSGGSATINSGHALQLINSDNLSAQFVLSNNVDLSETNVTVGTPASYAGMWAGTGFVPLGTDGAGNVLNGGNGFTGGFYGANHTITGLTIKRPTINDIGLFGLLAGNVSNVGLVNEAVSGGGYVGGLAGSSYGLYSGSVSQVFSTGTVHGANGYVGGLFGHLGEFFSLGQSYSTANVSAEGGTVGGLVGSGAGLISQSYATGSVSGVGSVGGLVGAADDSFSRINNVYATGNVSGGDSVGGLIGYQTYGSQLNNAYATGKVTGASHFGGLIGYYLGATTNAYWDSYSTVQSLAFGNESVSYPTINAITSDPSQSAAANYAYKTSAYANLTPANWVFFDGQTRPFLASEIPTAFLGVTTIFNAHQLQLINANAPTLGTSYVLGATIDASTTGAIVAGAPASYAGMWGSTGFVPIGTDGAGTKFNGGLGFTGSLNGQGFSINGLTEARSGVNYTGLFGQSSGSVSNLTLGAGSIAGGPHTGGLVGSQSGGSFGNISSALNVSGGNSVGGLFGDAVNVTLVNGTTSGTIAGSSYVGGLIGYQGGGSVASSSSSATINATAYFVGGLVGYQTGSISTGKATGAVTGGNNVGGLVGYEVGLGSSITGSSASGGASGTSNIGGLVGYAEGNIGTSSALGSVTGSLFIGGLVGRAYSGIDNSDTASGSVTGTYYTGGFAGYLDSGVTLSSGNASGIVHGGGFTGGFAGSSAATISGSNATGTTLTGINYSGGFIGYQGGGAVSSSSANASVTSTDNFVGGFDGGLAGGSLTSVTASGAVNGVSYVGGLVGLQSGGSISLSSESGAVNSSGTYTGGLVGVETLSNTIDQSFATGAVTANGDDVGGLIGFQDLYAIANNSYAKGNVTGGNNVGGLIGYEVGGDGNDYATGKVVGNSFVGGLVGRAFYGGIGNSYATGAVSGAHYVGGFVGYKDGNTALTNDHATGSVTATGDFVGGFAGYSTGNNDPLYTKMSNDYASGSVSGRDNVGGFIGYNDAGLISLSKATGTVTGRNSVGGLIGTLNSGLIDQVYASGTVGANGSYEGGLIGFQNAGTVTNTYALGTVSGTASYVGGLIGYMAGGTTSLSYDIGAVSGATGLGGVVGYFAGGNISNVAWNAQSTNLVNGYGFQSGGTFAATGLNTLQMQDFVSYTTNYSGFNFTSIWSPPNQSGQNGMAIPHYPGLRQVP